jgi:hypothetical protein
MRTNYWDGVWFLAWMGLCLLGAGVGGGVGTVMIVAGFVCLGIEIGRSY